MLDGVEAERGTAEEDSGDGDHVAEWEVVGRGRARCFRPYGSDRIALTH